MGCPQYQLYRVIMDTDSYNRVKYSLCFNQKIYGGEVRNIQQAMHHTVSMLLCSFKFDISTQTAQETQILHTDTFFSETVCNSTTDCDNSICLLMALYDSLLYSMLFILLPITSITHYEFLWLPVTPYVWLAMTAYNNLALLQYYDAQWLSMTP